MFIMTQATMYSLRGIGFLIGNGSMISPRCVGLLCHVRRHPARNAST
jgi:hypothetical protein